MTTETDLRDGPAPAPRSARTRAYLRLAKLDVLDYYLALPLAWALSAPSARLSGAVLTTLGLFLLGELFVIAAAVSFDDVTGYRDGSDAVNYSSDARRRRLARKPLVAGALSPAQALGFARLTAALGTLLWAAAATSAPHRPPWALLLGAVCLGCAVQYSWGLRISYHGFQELFLFGFGAGMVLVPYGLTAWPVTGAVLLQAVLFGLGPMLFGLYSNTNDIEGDRGVRRRTVAAMLPARFNRAFVVTVSLAEVAVIGLAGLVPGVPGWLPLALLPVVALRAAELTLFLRGGDVLRARRLAIHTHRVTVGLLLVLDLLPASLTGSTG
jgi:1,4-dihydroxy-2-naphthoate octaprenyltransferase